VKVILIGGEEISYYLGKMFLNRGDKVTMVNKKPQYCKYLAKKLKALIINGDGTDNKVLEQLELKSDDIFIALTPRDQDNLVACLAAREIYKIENAISLINDPENLEVFEKIGIEKTVSPVSIMAKAIFASSTVEKHIKSLLTDSPDSSDLEIFEIDINESSPVSKKQLKNIEIKDGIIGAIKRNNSSIIPKGDTYILPGDKLIIISKKEMKNSVYNTFIGET
jgi:trk system potassium uptake protein TrkA